MKEAYSEPQNLDFKTILKADKELFHLAIESCLPSLEVLDDLPEGYPYPEEDIESYDDCDWASFGEFSRDPLSAGAAIFLATGRRDNSVKLVSARYFEGEHPVLYDEHVRAIAVNEEGNANQNQKDLLLSWLSLSHEDPRYLVGMSLGNSVYDFGGSFIDCFYCDPFQDEYKSLRDNDYFRRALVTAWLTNGYDGFPDDDKYVKAREDYIAWRESSPPFGLEELYGAASSIVEEAYGANKQNSTD